MRLFLLLQALLTSYLRWCRSISGRLFCRWTPDQVSFVVPGHSPNGGSKTCLRRLSSSFGWWITRSYHLFSDAKTMMRTETNGYYSVFGFTGNDRHAKAAIWTWNIGYTWFSYRIQASMVLSRPSQGGLKRSNNYLIIQVNHPICIIIVRGKRTRTFSWSSPNVAFPTCWPPAAVAGQDCTPRQNWTAILRR